jgi:hypothetical protein
MGLDQYGFARKAEQKDIEIMSWRKHADLESYMADEYRQRGGEEVFNCVELELSEKDIAKLAVNYNSLNKGEGFFWGESVQGDILDTKQFIEKASEYLRKGYKIIYTSWW